MTGLSATAVAHPNIAFIKYWGNQDDLLRIPLNSSISMNLAGLETLTTVVFEPRKLSDTLVLNGESISGPALQRVTSFLDRIRLLAGKPLFAHIDSTNNFPTGAGIASSAAAFAALALAGSRALGLKLSERQLSILARYGSGSAARSIPSGFVEWYAGTRDDDSYAESIAPPDHWDLVDSIAVIQSVHKPVGSSEGHALAASSPLQNARVADAARRLDICRNAVLERDYQAFAEIVEQDSNLMHAVMMTSQPPLFYWEPASIEIMKAVTAWRKENIEVCYTLDAGPNVHVLSTSKSADQVKKLLASIPGVKQVLTAAAGGPARVV